MRLSRHYLSRRRGHLARGARGELGLFIKDKLLRAN